MKRRERGYTAVELMLALGLFAVGVSGIIAMQKLTVVSNQHAKNLAIATHIAEAWMDQLATDATTWNTTTGTNGTKWVVNSTANDGVWQLPAWNDERQLGPGFDALGAPIDPGGDVSMNDARFCTHVRLTTLFDQAGGLVNGRQILAGNGLARAEVRVFWLRDGSPAVANACTQSTTIAAVTGPGNSYHHVIKVSAVRQHGSTK